MRFFRGVSASVFVSFLLAGCITTTQSPAPVQLYGTSEGGGSAGVHTVTRGENLWDISNRYNIVMRDIVITNDLRAPFILNSGQRIKLPPPREYRVRDGDSLTTVARLYGVSPSELARMNNLKAPYSLRIGQILKLPSVTSKTMPAVAKAPRLDVSPPPVSQPAPVARVDRGVEVPPPPEKPEMSPSPIDNAVMSSNVPVPGTKPSAPARVQKASLGSRAKIPSTTPPRSSSTFLRPVNGKIISAYGPKANGQHNDGINILAPRGSSVKAAENGVVVYAGSDIKGSGNLVLVRHADRWMTAYAHLDRIDVQRGATIKRGQTIGTVGQSGSVDQAQLHFEVRRGTEAINPTRYMGG